jgi:hypothetical protein
VRTSVRRLVPLTLIAALLMAAPAVALGPPGGAHLAATKPKPKKKKKKKKAAPKVTAGRIKFLGFRVAATPKDSLTEIPPIPLTLTGSGGTFRDCGSAFPLSVPTDGLWATLIVITELTGRADTASGWLVQPVTGDRIPMTYSAKTGPATGVVTTDLTLPLVTRNGTYSLSAAASLKSGTRTLHGTTSYASVTVDCTRP